MKRIDPFAFAPENTNVPSPCSSFTSPTPLASDLWPRWRGDRIKDGIKKKKMSCVVVSPTFVFCAREGAHAREGLRQPCVREGCRTPIVLPLPSGWTPADFRRLCIFFLQLQPTSSHTTPTHVSYPVSVLAPSTSFMCYWCPLNLTIEPPFRRQEKRMCVFSLFK